MTDNSVLLSSIVVSPRCPRASLCWPTRRRSHGSGGRLSLESAVDKGATATTRKRSGAVRSRSVEACYRQHASNDGALLSLFISEYVRVAHTCAEIHARCETISVASAIVRRLARSLASYVCLPIERTQAGGCNDGRSTCALGSRSL